MQITWNDVIGWVISFIASATGAGIVITIKMKAITQIGNNNRTENSNNSEKKNENVKQIFRKTSIDGGGTISQGNISKK